MTKSDILKDNLLKALEKSLGDVNEDCREEDGRGEDR